MKTKLEIKTMDDLLDYCILRYDQDVETSEHITRLLSTMPHLSNAHIEYLRWWNNNTIQRRLIFGGLLLAIERGRRDGELLDEGYEVE